MNQSDDESRFRIRSAVLSLEEAERDGISIDYLLPKDRLSLAPNCWRVQGEGPLAVTIVLSEFGTTWRRAGCDKLELSKSLNDFMGDNGRANFTSLIHIHQQRL